jgi:sialate O-acetylesterase
VLPLLALALAAAAPPAKAGALSLAAIFSDHMVLQRDKPVPVWGWAEPGDEVTVEFAGQRRSGNAGADGKWLVRLEPLAANTTPGTLTVASAKSGGPLVVADVLVGEVWLGSGQSNMAMQVSRADDFDREKAAADLPIVRMFREDSKGAGQPQPRGNGSWEVCTPDTVGTFSATLFFFGREIHAALGVPVGLVNSSVGGTPIEAWIDQAAQQAVPELAPCLAAIERERAAFDREAVRQKHEQAVAAWEEKARVARQAGKPIPGRPKNPLFRHESHAVAGLYNGKIAPLVPFAIRGVVWYQGEANAHPGKGKFYGAQLRTLVTDWRAKWGEELPFAWVQLPNFGVQREDWMLVREGMLETLALPKTGMAITVDIGDPKDIHPRNKQDVGRRLAAWALADIYDKPVPARSGPLPAGSEIRGSEVVCRFRDADGLRDRDGGEVEGFVIAGEESQWKPARARIEGASVIVSAADVPKPVAVRYAWSPNPKCDLVNAAGLPASPFRTDTWQITAAAATDP